MKKPQPKTQSLPASWPELEERLRSAEMVAPRSGFSRRWLVRATGATGAEPAYTPGRLAWLGLAAGAVVSAGLLAALVALWLPLAQLPVGSLLADAVSYVSSLAVATRVLLTTLSGVLSEIPSAVWLVVCTSALAALFLLAMAVDTLKLFKETK